MYSVLLRLEMAMILNFLQIGRRTRIAVYNSPLLNLSTMENQEQRRSPRS